MVKIKSHYPAFQKASRTIADIIINHQKDPKCVKCQKKLNLGKCADNSIKGFKIGKRKNSGMTFSSLPFSFISGTFVDTPYSLLCYKCTNFVKRSIGFIPEIYDDKYFPQVSAPFITLDDGKIDWDSFKAKKKTKWTIRFQGKEIPHTKQLKKELMMKGIMKYKKDFPECPHNIEKLYRLLNGHALYDKMYGKW